MDDMPVEVRYVLHRELTTPTRDSKGK